MIHKFPNLSTAIMYFPGLAFQNAPIGSESTDDVCRWGFVSICPNITKCQHDTAWVELKEDGPEKVQVAIGEDDALSLAEDYELLYADDKEEAY